MPIPFRCDSRIRFVRGYRVLLYTQDSLCPAVLTVSTNDKRTTRRHSFHLAHFIRHVPNRQQQSLWWLHQEVSIQGITVIHCLILFSSHHLPPSQNPSAHSRPTSTSSPQKDRAPSPCSITLQG